MAFVGTLGPGRISCGYPDRSFKDIDQNLKPRSVVALKRYYKSCPEINRKLFSECEVWQSQRGQSGIAIKSIAIRTSGAVWAGTFERRDGSCHQTGTVMCLEAVGVIWYDDHQQLTGADRDDFESAGVRVIWNRCAWKCETLDFAGRTPCQENSSKPQQCQRILRYPIFRITRQTLGSQ